MSDKIYDFSFRKNKMEKVAETRMSRYSTDWEVEIMKKVSEERPYVLKGSDFMVSFKEMDSDRGYGFGSIMVINSQPQPQIHNKEGYNATSGAAAPGAPIALPTKKAFIPVIIKDFKMSDLDVFVLEGQPHALTEHNWARYMNNAEIFGNAVRMPSLSRYGLDETSDKMSPPYSGSARTLQRSTGMFAYASEGLKKTANHNGPILNEILPTINKADRDALCAHVGVEEDLAPFAGTPSLEIIDKIMQGGALAPEDQMVALQGALPSNVIRIKDLGASTYEVTTVSDELYAPTIRQMSITDVLKEFGERVPTLGQQLADSQLGRDLVIAVDHKERNLIVMEDYASNPSPITQSGDYYCLTSGGELAHGYVCTDIYDAAGGACGHSLFMAGDKWAFQGTMMGDVCKESIDLKDGMPTKRAYGTFLYSDEGKLACMVPFQIVGLSEREGCPVVQVIDTFSNPITFIVMPGVQKCVSLTGNKDLDLGGLINANAYAIPEHYQYVALGNRVTLLSSKEDIQSRLNTKMLVHWADAKFKKDMQIGDSAEAANLLWIKRADDKFRMEGPSVSMIHKDGSGTLVEEQTAIFYLATLGASVAQAKQILDRCRANGRVTITNAKDLSLGLTKLNAAKDIRTELEAVCKDLRKDLFKEAAVLVEQQKLMASYNRTVSAFPKEAGNIFVMDKVAGELAAEDSVDTLLSLSFINPENLSTYLGSLERMERTEDDLAQLLILIRLGLDNVNELSAKNAMKNLSDVIEGLRFVNYLIDSKKILNG